MDKIILANKTEFEIADGASLGNIKIQAENFDAIKTITDAFTEANLKEVTFTHNDAESGKYTDLKPNGFTYTPNKTEDTGKHTDVKPGDDNLVTDTVTKTAPITYTVTIMLRTKTDLEKVIDELKAGHESNAGAIQDLADMVAGGDE